MLLSCALAWPSAATAVAPPLEPGTHGPRVEALQRAFGVRVDGVYGAELRTIVMALQRANGLRADGTVGPATWGLLERIRARTRARRNATASSALSRPRRGVERVVQPVRRAIGGRTLSRSRHAVERTVAPLRRAIAGGTLSRPHSTQRGGLRGRRAAARSTLTLRRRAERRALPAARRSGRQAALATRRAAIASRRDLSVRKGVRTIVARSGDDRPLLPLVVRRVIAAADEIATMPYRYGGGHGNFDDSGYDCSGSISYALHGGGLLDVALASGGFMSWGEPGPGRYITIYASPGHAFMVVAGRRFDTSGRGQTGSRWQSTPRGAGAGYVVRHPAGL